MDAKHRSEGIVAMPVRLIALAIASIATLALSGLLATRMGAAIDGTVRVELEIEDVRLATLDLLVAAKGAESAQRGYAIAGEPEQITQFREHAAAVNRGIARLQERTEHNPGQQRSVEALTTQWAALSAFYERGLDEAGAGRFENARTLAASGAGAALSQQLHETLNVMAADYSESLAEKRARSSRSGWLLRASNTLATALGILLVVGLLLAGREEIKVRAAAANELRMQKLAVESHLAELATVKDRLEAADRAKVRLLAAAKHELLTPLNHIIGFSELLCDQVPGPLNAEQARQMKIVRNSGERLRGLITNMIDVVIVESGMVQLEIVPVRLNTLVKECCEAHAIVAQAKGLTLSCGWCDSSVMVLADGSRLYEVLNNILANAVKFTDAGSINVTMDIGPEMARVSVRDTGIGIAESDQQQLFDPFHRADESGVTWRPGVGLGLSISRRLMRAMSGEVGLISRARSGSTFWLEIPVAYRPAEVPDTGSAAS